MTKIILFTIPLFASCTTPPPPSPHEGVDRPPTLRIFHHTCDSLGVNSVTIGATEAGVATLTWDNHDICGSPA